MSSVTNLYPIRKNGKEGYIDELGKVIIEPKYDFASYFSHDIAKVGNKPLTCPYPKCINISQYDLSSVFSKNTDEKKDIKPKECPYVNPSNCSYVLPLWGFINKYGEYMSEPIFDHAPSHFSKDKTHIAVEIQGKWGFLHLVPDKYLNTKICFSINPTFDDAELYVSEGLACVKIDNKWGYIDYQKVENKLMSIALFCQEIVPVDGTKLYAIESKFDDAYSFSEGLARVMVDAYLDPKYEDPKIIWFHKPSTNGKWGFIDKTGNFVIKPQFEFAGPFIDGLAHVSFNGKVGFINKKGNFVIDPQFESAQPFSEGLACVKIDNKFGYIDKNGKFTIKPIFDSATSFKEEFALVEYNGKYNYVNKQGKLLTSNKLWKKIISLKFNDAGSGFDYAKEFVDGLALVSKNNKYGYIDKTGKYAIKPQFDEAKSFIGELAPVALNNKFKYINKKGDIIWTSDEYPYIWFK